jgi:antitoxin component of MazEF toxin-antitoxin module
VQQFDGTDIVMLVLRDGGSAEMRIPQASIRDVKVRRSSIR